MTTIRQLQKLWQAKDYTRLLTLFLDNRPEASLRLRHELARPIPIAALIVIRLDELNQAHTPFCAHMLRTLLAAQEPDGGFVDPLTTTLCLRALMCCNGDGLAIERALGYLAVLQKTIGLWPRIPIRRMPGDPFVSAFILYHLAGDSRFARKIRLPDAFSWFENQSANQLDPETARLWRSITRRRLPACFFDTTLTTWS